LRLDRDRPPRLPVGVLPRTVGDEAEVRPPPAPDRTVPHELPAAGSRVEGDPRQSGRDQLVPLLDGAPVAGPPDLAAALQPVRGDARARLHLAAVRRPPDLRCAREPGSSAARGGERSRREPSAGVLAGDASAVPARRRRGLPLRLHPHARRVRHAVARRRNVRIHVRQPDRRPFRDRVSRLADGIDAGHLPAPRRRPAHGRLLPVPQTPAGGGGLMDVALSRTGAWVLRAFFVLVVAFLYAPIVVLLVFSFNDAAVPSFPLSGFTLEWYRQFLTNS